MNNQAIQACALLELDKTLANCSSNIGLKPLDLVDQYNMKIILLRFGARHTLHGVARLGIITIAESIMKKCPEEVNVVNKYGESPLHVAAIFGQTKMIQVGFVIFLITKKITTWSM